MKDRNSDIGVEALRWSLVVIFALFGIAKFTAYEAEGVAGIAEHYWLFAPLYWVGGARFASNVIGCIELTTGLMLALGSRSVRLSAVGGAMGVCTFLVTLSFMIGNPRAWEEGYGFPFLGSSGQFLVKDLVLLSGCLCILLTSLRAIRDESHRADFQP